MSLLTKFELKNVYGFKSLKMSFDYKTTIFIAENGVGKTTLLNTLYALLTGQFERLRTVVFSEAEIEFGSKKIIFDKKRAFKDFNAEEVLLKLTRDDNSRINLFLREYFLQSEFEEFVEAFILEGRVAAQSFPIFRNIMRNTPFDGDDIFEMLNDIKSLTYEADYISQFKNEVDTAMGDLQVLYLPTYRRIEASFDEVNLSRRHQSKGRSFSRNTKEVEREDLIYFGLSDVEEKLQTMSQSIQESMIKAYSQLGSNLIRTLLSFSKDNNVEDNNLPINDEELKLMLNRIQKTGSDTEEIITLNESGKLKEERYKALVYVLRDLISSYNESLPAEKAIETFELVVNRYFEEFSPDEKSMRFDKMRLKIEILNKILKKSLPFNSLSSGEKQMVSIFAKVILNYDKKYLILIDEPELSLSLAWQRNLLPDISKTTSCRQLIAITHSPFIFNNEFEDNVCPIDKTIMLDNAS